MIHWWFCPKKKKKNLMKSVKSDLSVSSVAFFRQVLTPPSCCIVCFVVGEVGRWILEHGRQTRYLWALSPALFLLFTLRHGLTKLSCLTLNSSCNPGKPWTHHLLASTSLVSRIAGLHHQTQVNLLFVMWKIFSGNFARTASSLLFLELFFFSRPLLI